MKRIAFIDDQIDNFHANTFARLLAENDTGFALSAVWARQRDGLSEWAAKHSVPAVDSIADLASLADYLMVLAPSTPETHPELCAEAFRLGKTTYVDKTFAPDTVAARAIFALADEYGVAIQTSSVLRYTELQVHCADRPEQPPQSISTWASGGNFNEYLIHPLESVVSAMGSEIEAITAEEVAGFTRITLRFSRNRIATIHFHVGHQTPFFHVVSDAERTTPVSIDGSAIFRNGLLGTLDFFRAGKALIPRDETLAIMQAIDTLRR